MKIGNVEIGEGALLAPLAGFTDVGMRAVAKRMGAALTYTEMVSAKGLCYNSEKTRELLATYPTEVPCAAQIFGGDPEYIGRCLHDASLEKFDIIDINMGCPVPKIVKNKEGSYLLNDRDRAARIVEAAVKNSGGRPITVKMRIGYRAGENVAVDFAKALEDAGASAITVHGRTREQFYTGTANWDVVRDVVEACNIPVIANGDVVNKDTYDRVMAHTGASAVMIGRGALGNVGIFREVMGESADLTTREILLMQIDVLREYHEDRYIYNTMKKHVCYYTKGMHDARAIKDKVTRVQSVEELIEVVKASF